MSIVPVPNDATSADANICGSMDTADQKTCLSTDTAFQPHLRIGSDQEERGLWQMFGPPVERGLCPRGVVPVWGWDQETGEARYIYPCTANSCPVCGLKNVHRLDGRIFQTKPETFLTLTGLPDDWTETKVQMTSFMRMLRRQIPDFKMVYAVERDPSLLSATCHLHGYARDVPPDDLLSWASAKVGWGEVVHTAPVEDRRRGGYGYPWKQAVWNPEAYEDYRQINGSRMYHASQGWLSRSTTSYVPPRATR